MENYSQGYLDELPADLDIEILHFGLDTRERKESLSSRKLLPFSKFSNLSVLGAMRYRLSWRAMFSLIFDGKK